MWSPLFANLYLLLWFGNFLAKLFKCHTDVTNVKSDRINLCIYVVYSTDLVGCAGAEEDLGYGRIGMGVGLEVGEGGNISVTDCCPTATPPSSCQLAFRLCRSTLLCGFGAPHWAHWRAWGEGGGQWGVTLVWQELKASALTSIVVFRSSGVCIWGEIAICWRIVRMVISSDLWRRWQRFCLKCDQCEN